MPNVRQSAKWIGLLLFLVFLALALQLRQRDLEFPVEPDFSWQLVEVFRKFLLTFDLARVRSVVPRPGPYVYLDGQFIVYGAFDWLLHSLSGVAALQSHFPNGFAYAYGAALLANIIAYSAACTVFYAAVFRLTGYISISALLATGLFFAPQMIAINIGRVDYLNTLPIMIIFYCSCVVAMGQQRIRHAIALGLAMAFVATIKLNGLFFGIFPTLAVIAAFRFSAIKRLALFAAISLGVFMPAYAYLMRRYFFNLSPAEFVQNYMDSIALTRQWTAVLTGPPTYYNIELMEEHGTAFIILYLACAGATLALAGWHKSRTAIFLALSFIVLTVGGAASIKYGHSGYHMLPVFFAQIGFVAAALLGSSINPYLKAAALAAGAAVVVLSIVDSSAVYAEAVARRKAEAVGLQSLKREPRDWLRSHVSPGTTVCILTDSGWVLPPLDGFNVTEKPLGMPYLDAAALAQSTPPSLADAKTSCPVIVTSDFHRDIYDRMMRNISPELAARWESFFAALNERYPPVVFSSSVAIYAKENAVYDLRDK